MLNLTTAGTKKHSKIFSVGTSIQVYTFITHLRFADRYFYSSSYLYLALQSIWCTNRIRDCLHTCCTLLAHFTHNFHIFYTERKHMVNISRIAKTNHELCLCSPRQRLVSCHSSWYWHGRLRHVLLQWPKTIRLQSSLVIMLFEKKTLKMGILTRSVYSISISTNYACKSLQKYESEAIFLEW